MLDQSADNQQVIERCYPLPPQNTLMLSELPEPPIPLSEIGPIPPPPMFSSPSPTLLARQRQIPLSDCEDEGKCLQRNAIQNEVFFLEQLITHDGIPPLFVAYSNLCLYNSEIKEICQ